MRKKQRSSLLLEVLVACALLGVALPLFVRVPVERLKREVVFLYRVELQREIGIRLVEAGVSLFSLGALNSDMLMKKEEFVIPVSLAPGLSTRFLAYKQGRVCAVSQDKKHILVEMLVEVPKGPGGQPARATCQYYVHLKSLEAPSIGENSVSGVAVV